jgi:hypothetical protein
VQRGYRGVAGSPVRPYAQFVSNYGSDVWLTITFLDVNGNVVTPSTISYRIDSLTNSGVVLGDTPIAVPASTITINVPGALNIFLTDIGQSSQLNQLTVTATYVGGAIQKQVFMYEIIAIQTVGGAGT